MSFKYTALRDVIRVGATLIAGALPAIASAQGLSWQRRAVQREVATALARRLRSADGVVTVMATDAKMSYRARRLTVHQVRQIRDVIGSGDGANGRSRRPGLDAALRSLIAERGRSVRWTTQGRRGSALVLPLATVPVRVHVFRFAEAL